MIQNENYNIICNLTLTNGETINLGPYIKEIIILHSLNLPISECSFIINRIAQKFSSQILEVNLTIQTLKYTGEVIHEDKFILIPMENRYLLRSPVPGLNLQTNYTGTTERDIWQFQIKPCYITATIPVGPVLKFSTNIEELLNEIKPKNSEYIIGTDLNQKTIPQIYIKKQPFFTAINYLSFLYGLSSGPTCRTIIPDTQNPENTKILISDIHQNLTEAEYYDKTFIIRVPDQKMMDKITKEVEQNAFVVDFSIEFSSKIISPVNYTIITKPYEYIYKFYKFNEEELLNNYGSCYLKYDREIENAKGLISSEAHSLIFEHSCFDDQIYPITSMLTYEYMFNTRGSVTFDELPNFSFIWPGEIANLEVPSLDYTQYSGLFVIESVLYRITREKSRAWQTSAEITMVRSNLIYNVPNIKTKKESEKKKVTTNINTSKVTEELNKMPDKINDLDSPVADLSNIAQTEIPGIINNLQDNQNNINTETSNIENNLNNADSHIQNAMNSSHANDIINYVQNLKSELDLILPRFSTMQNYYNDFTSYINNAINLINIFTNTKSDIFDKIVEVSNLLNPVKSLQEDMISQMNLDPSYIQNYLQNNSSVLTKMKSLIQNISPMIERIIPQSNNILYKINNNLSNIDNMIREVNFIKEKIDYLLSETYDDSDVDYLHQYIQKNLLVDDVRFMMSNLQNDYDIINILNDTKNKIENSVITFNNTKHNFSNYVTQANRNISNIATSIKNLI